MSLEESLAIVAHELRSPIGAIRTAVGVMESAGALPGAMERARRLVARQIGQLFVLVEVLLDFGALARGTLIIRREWIDVVPEVEAAVESCSWAISGAGHSLSICKRSYGARCRRRDCRTVPLELSPVGR
jgi:two-component system, sensor histidine kinase